MAAAAQLLHARLLGLDMEAALDQVDLRQAAAGLAGALAELVRLSGLPPQVFLRAALDTSIAEHMARELAPASGRQRT